MQTFSSPGGNCFLFIIPGCGGPTSEFIPSPIIGAITSSSLRLRLSTATKTGHVRNFSTSSLKCPLRVFFFFFSPQQSALHAVKTVVSLTAVFWKSHNSNRRQALRDIASQTIEMGRVGYIRKIVSQRNKTKQ